MKTIALYLSILLLLGACSRGGSNNPNPKNPQDPGYTLEGTVVKVFNLLIPQAHATNFAVLLQGGKDDDCAAAQSDRCAYLIDASLEEEKLIAATPVISGKFKFRFSNPLESDKIYKVIVRGWDPKAKRPIIGKAFREITLKGSEIGTSVEVNPESTLSSEVKLDFLRKNKSSFEISAAVNFVLNSIFNVFRDGVRNLRETFLDLIQTVNEDVSDLLTRVLDGESGDGISSELLNRQIRGQEWSVDKINNSTNIQVLQMLEQVNLGLEKVNRSLGNISVDEITRLKNIYNNITENSVDGVYIAINNRQEQLKGELTEEEKLTISGEVNSLQDELTERESVLNLAYENLENACLNWIQFKNLLSTKQELSSYKLLVNVADERYNNVRILLMNKMEFTGEDSRIIPEEEQTEIETICEGPESSGVR